MKRICRSRARLVSVTVLVLVMTGTRQASAIGINFESVPGYPVPFTGQFISNEYESNVGITFSLLGGGLPFLAQVGGSPTGLGGGPCFFGDPPCGLAFYGPGPEGANTVGDGVALAPAQNVGNFFLTGGFNSPTNSLVVTYTTPTAAAGGRLIDIDGDETWEVQARNSVGAVIDTYLLGPSDPLAGDGKADPWFFQHGSADIASIVFSFTCPPELCGLVGYGFDFYSPFTADPLTDTFADFSNIPEPATFTLTLLGLAGVALRLRKKRSNQGRLASPGTLP